MIRGSMAALTSLAMMCGTPVHAQKTERDTTRRSPTGIDSAPSSQRRADKADAGATSMADLTTAAQDAVRSLLRDPASAQFSGIFVGHHRKTGRLVICGYVNARNGFGGYTGATPFYSSPEKTEVGGPDAGFFFPRRFKDACGQ